MRSLCRATALVTVCALGAANPARADAPITTAFTYQGKLADSGTSANGQYDLVFTLFGQAAGGAAVAGPLTLATTTVTGGLFSVQLDFGANAFNGHARWLEIAVKPSAGGSFTTLAPRQPLTVTPYALQSRGMYLNASDPTGLPFYG
jgi:hypothetical protein